MTGAVRLNIKQLILVYKLQLFKSHDIVEIAYCLEYILKNNRSSLLHIVFATTKLVSFENNKTIVLKKYNVKIELDDVYVNFICHFQHASTFHGNVFWY